MADIRDVLDRSIRAERATADLYDRLAGRFGNDAEIHELFRELAVEERGHARGLAEWRARLERERAERRPIPLGFEDPFAKLEATLLAAAVQGEMATEPDHAFAIALALESSELDGIYRVLVRAQLADSSPTAFARTDEVGRHHERLLTAVRARSRDEVVRLRAAQLEREYAI